MKLVPKCPFLQVLQYDIKFWFMGGSYTKKSENNKTTCFEKVFFRKNSSRELQWYMFRSEYRLRMHGIGEKSLQIFLTGRPP